MALHSWDNISLILWHTSLFNRRKKRLCAAFFFSFCVVWKINCIFFGRRITIDFLSHLFVLTQQNRIGKEDAEKITECIKIKMRVQEWLDIEGISAGWVFYFLSEVCCANQKKFNHIWFMPSVVGQSILEYLPLWRNWNLCFSLC